MNLLKNNKIKMVVFDMAGTTVEEGGLVYKTLYNTLKSFNYDIDKKEIKSWHGLNKYHVLDRYILKELDAKQCKQCKGNCFKYTSNKKKHDVYKTFESKLTSEYFHTDKLSLIDDNLPDMMNKLRENNIKVGLNTGYPKDIQQSIIDKLNMEEFIDSYVSSQDVEYARPYPFMIYKLMEMNKIASPSQVIKVGDTSNDILEGLNAGCYKSIGVLTGAETREELYESGANIVLDSVMDLIS